MVKKILVGCCVFAFAASAFAAENAAAPANGNTHATQGHMKGQKMAETPTVGPMSRKVMHEAQDKKGVDALYKQMEAAYKKGDMDAVAGMIDFPVLMITDNAKGEFMYTTMDKDAWMKSVGQSMQGMPKNAKMSVRHTAHFLSDSLANVDEQFSMSSGRMHGTWNGAEMVINKGGKWMVKMMAEAGWGNANMTQAMGQQNAGAGESGAGK